MDADQDLIEDSPPPGQSQPDAFRTFETPGGDEKCEDEQSREEDEEAGDGDGDGQGDDLDWCFVRYFFADAFIPKRVI